MIISASRRTDIPAFYAEWFMNRIEAGYCTVPNPFNRNHVSRVSLAPQDVDVIVFWTRNPRPLLAQLAELDSRGYRYYFLYTLLDYPRLIDPKSPPPAASLNTFRELVGHIGPERVVWRYDPIVFSDKTDPQFHQRTYRQIATELCGYTFRSVISIVTFYRKMEKRLRALGKEGIELTTVEGEALHDLMRALARTAHENNMEILSCAQNLNLSPSGIRPGKCIDDALISDVFGITVPSKKDPSQRSACGCVTSRDIGVYDSCLFGCKYCYATTSFDRARASHEEHDPSSPSLIGWYER